MILSIDVGIKNLAMCLLDEDRENLVVEWDVSGVPPQHADGVYVSMKNISMRDLGYSMRRLY